MMKKNSISHKSENISKSINTLELCEYGCGQIAKFKLINNKKLCCSKTPSGCKKLREVNFQVHKTTIEILKKKHPYFYEVENPRESIDGRIEVKCKFCKRWFQPKKEDLRSRISHLEHKDGNKCSFLFCSKNCKFSSDFYHFNKRVNRKILNKYKKYVKDVYFYTERSLKINGEKIKNLELRGRKFGYQLDHKFSIFDGFNKNIDPKIIGHWKNLEIITSLENIKKYSSSTLTIEQLLFEIAQEN
jgi:hypothetical protein